MELSGKQYEDLQKALESAFHTPSELRQMVRFKLDKNLHTIASNGNLSEIIFQLIAWAESQNRVPELIKKACEAKPGNLDLKNFAEQLIRIDSEVKLCSEREIDYTRLRGWLAAKMWKEADQETERVMLKASSRGKKGWLDPESINKFPCQDLRTIDQLWVKYSKGHFGFSVQKCIWESVGGTPDSNWETYCLFSEQVGWCLKGDNNETKWLFYPDLTFNHSAPAGHLPCGSSIPLWRRFHSRGNPLVGGWVIALFSRVASCNL